MNLYLQLGLVGGMLMLKPDQIPTTEQNPQLLKVLGSLGVGDFDMNDLTAIRERYLEITATLESQYDYYDPQDLMVNPTVDAYLRELFDLYEERRFDLPKQIAIRVCAAGNQKGHEDVSEGVSKFVNELNMLATRLEELCDRVPDAWSEFQLALKSAEYIDNVLDIVNTFVMTKAGMLAGVQEFPPINPEDLPASPEPDFSVVECSGDNGCACGCAPDHGELLIEGMEDFLNGKDTYAARYAVGATSTTSMRLNTVSGTEGPVLDSIKDMAKKAYDAVVESLKALKELVSPEEDKEKAAATASTADANKKALQAMENGSLAINPTAKEGLSKLAMETYPGGEMKKITDQLQTASDGARVIDALSGLMNKEINDAAELSKSQSDADKAAQDLKSTTDKSSSVDESNKDVVDTFRTQVKDKVGQAKNVFKQAKDKVKGHNKRIAGIQKAIKGINPLIFPDPSKESDAKKEKS